MSTYQQICEQIGHDGEVAVAELLREQGYNVRLDGGNHYHDLVVDGTTTIEVKTAHASAGSNGNRERWQFTLYDNDGQHRPVEEDVLILRCQDGEGAWHYVIPGAILPAKLTKIDITSPRDRYRGRYTLFLEAWELLAITVAANRGRERQFPLVEEPEIVF